MTSGPRLETGPTPTSFPDEHRDLFVHTLLSGETVVVTRNGDTSWRRTWIKFPPSFISSPLVHSRRRDGTRQHTD